MDDLDVVIACDSSAAHNWMAFACWYSLNVNLPDARVRIVAKRGIDGPFFTWAARCGVSLLNHREMPGESKLWRAQVAGVRLPCLILDPDVLAVREPTPEFLALRGNAQDVAGKVWFLKDRVEKPIAVEPLLCRPAKDDNFCTFTSYEGGWGKFVTTACINSGDYPFRKAERWQADEMSLNELKVLELWKRMDRLFNVVARG